MVTRTGPDIPVRGQHHETRFDQGHRLTAGSEPQVRDSLVGDVGEYLEAIADIEDDIRVDGSFVDSLDDAWKLVTRADFHWVLASCFDWKLPYLKRKARSG